MPAFKTIYAPVGCYGGHAYRVTSNGFICHLQESKGGYARYKTLITVSRKDWDIFSALWDIYNPYRHNPAFIVKAYNAAVALPTNWPERA